MSESNLKYLPGMKKLDFLNAADLHITSVGLAYIGKCQGLQELHIAWNRKISDDDLKLLMGLQKLTNLDLRACAITDRGLANLVSLKRLKFVTLAETSVTPEGLQKLRGLHLKKLVITDRNYTEKQLEMIQQVCPRVIIEQPGKKTVDRYTQRLFAPITRHRD